MSSAPSIARLPLAPLNTAIAMLGLFERRFVVVVMTSLSTVNTGVQANEPRMSK